MIYLKADTAVEVLIGPAVAVGDGFTPVTNLVGASADEYEIIKYNGATTLTGAAITNALAALTSAVDGYYSLELTTSETDTEGPLWIVIQDDSLILPIRHEFMVVNANVYDSLFAASGTDTLDVQVAGMNADTITSSAVAADAIDSSAVSSGAVQKISGLPGFSNLTASASGTTTTLIDSALTQADGHWTGIGIRFESGTNNGQVRLCTGFTASSDELQFTPAVETATAASDIYSFFSWSAVDARVLVGGLIPTPNTTGVPDVNVQEWLDGVVATPTVAGVPEVDLTHVGGATTATLPGQTAPPNAPTWAQIFGWLYKMMRNKKDNDGTTVQLYDDAGTVVDAKATVSESGGTVTQNEWESGP